MRDFDLKNYLLGFLSAAIVSVIMYFVLTAHTGSPAFTQLTVDEAHEYYTNYYTHATSQNEILKGFSFTTGDFFEAVSSVYAADHGIVGYRVYMGIDGGGKNMGIIVGVNAEGKDLTGDSDVILGAYGKMGPCPNICDNNSPITN